MKIWLFIQNFRFKTVFTFVLTTCKYLFIWVVLLFSLLELSLQIFAYTYIYVAPSQTKKIEKRPKIKILAVGESTTGGLWIEERSYPIQLKEKLNRHFNCENCVQINTLELPGASSSWSLAELPNYIEKYKPDIALIMAGFNDPFFYTYNIELQAIQNLFEKGAHYPQLYKYILDLLRASKVLSLTKFIYIQTFVSADSLYDFAEVAYRHGKVTDNRIKFGEKYREIIDSQTKMNLRDMVRISKYNGVEPILMTYHESGINSLIREVSIEENIHLIDIEANFFKKCPRVECIFTRDNWHPNEKGYDYISNITMKYLISKDLLQK